MSVRGIALCVMVVMAVAGSVRADTIANLIAQLDDSSDRVRTSAVLALMNQENPRAIDALAHTLKKSGETKNVRGLAATALGRIVMGGKPNADERRVAVDALIAAESDPDPYVSAKATAARSQLGSSTPTPKSNGGGGGIYVNIGPMSSKTGNTADDPKYRASMQKTSTQTLKRIAPQYQTEWGGGIPTKAQLAAKNMTGFYVDGTLNEIKIEKSGNSSKVSCKVNMLLASFPDKAVFGFLNGGAAVQASASTTDIALASQDCVAAVVESLITKQIVPTIKAKAP